MGRLVPASSGQQGELARWRVGAEKDPGMGSAADPMLCRPDAPHRLRVTLIPAPSWTALLDYYYLLTLFLFGARAIGGSRGELPRQLRLAPLCRFRR